MIYTTLTRIREHNPCADGWRKLLTHLGKNDPYAPLAYSTIIESNGLDDALWCLRAEPQHASIWRMYAVRCARRVQHLMTDECSLQALDIAERYARGLATGAELDAARAAVMGASSAAALDAVRAAVMGAASAASEAAASAAASAAAEAAAWAAAWDAARAEQTADFKALLAAHHAMPWESCALVDWWQATN